MIGKPANICGPRDTGPDDLATDSTLLSTAVEQAGAIARHYFRGDLNPRYKGPGQIVTDADIAIDQQLHDHLIGNRPGDGWLSEERPDISAALLIDGKPAVASVFNPITSEHFQAVRGAGATLNGNPLVPSQQSTIHGASILASSGEMKKRRWPDAFPEASFTTIGSLAYKLALVASGHFSGLVSLRSCSDWDIAAAVLLIEEAGAMLSDGKGHPIRLNQSTVRHHGLVAAGAKPLYTDLVNRLEMIASSEG